MRKCFVVSLLEEWKSAAESRRLRAGEDETDDYFRIERQDMSRRLKAAPKFKPRIDAR